MEPRSERPCTPRGDADAQVRRHHILQVFKRRVNAVEGLSMGTLGIIRTSQRMEQFISREPSNVLGVGVAGTYGREPRPAVVGLPGIQMETVRNRLGGLLEEFVLVDTRCRLDKANPAGALHRRQDAEVIDKICLTILPRQRIHHPRANRMGARRTRARHANEVLKILHRLKIVPREGDELGILKFW